MQMKFENAEVSVIKSKRKTVSIQVKPNEVIIRAPIKMKEKEIEKFVESKRNWIEKHLQSLSEKQKLFENIEPYSDKEIRSFVKQAKEIVPKKVEFYAEKIGVTYDMQSVRSSVICEVQPLFSGLNYSPIITSWSILPAKRLSCAVSALLSVFSRIMP